MSSEQSDNQQTEQTHQDGSLWNVLANLKWTTSIGYFLVTVASVMGKDNQSTLSEH